MTLHKYAGTQVRVEFKNGDIQTGRFLVAMGSVSKPYKVGKYGAPFHRNAVRNIESAEQGLFRIITSGPVIDKEGTLQDIKAYVEQNAPLKRGWTGRWEYRGRWRWTYVRSNSKGRDLPGYGVTVVRRLGKVD